MQTDLADTIKAAVRTACGDIAAGAVSSGCCNKLGLVPYSRALVSGWAPGTSAEDHVASALSRAVKPVEAEPACCDSTLLERCCEPAGKAQCCGDTATPPGACKCESTERG